MRMSRVDLRSVFAALVFAAVGCQDTKTIFVAFPLFDDPPSAAASFLGYSDQDDKLPVCGNCHVGQNAAWQQTAHAGAWETLQVSGSAQDFCERCHTVNENGNLTEEPGVGPQPWTVGTRTCSARVAMDPAWYT